jgi:RNA polymerase sigma-70 factor (ECF subfamily)
VSSGASAELRPSDGALMERVVARDESALAQLYDRYSGMVSAVAMRVLRDAGAAEEILQDIFYQLWRNAAQFDPGRGSLAGWLLVSTRNRAISRLRRKNPGDAGNETKEQLAANISFPFHLETAVAQQQLLSKVKGAMGSLPQPQREAVELAYFEGLTHSEIAERTGEPLGTIKTRLRSALETLKQAFKA